MFLIYVFVQSVAHIEIMLALVPLSNLKLCLECGAIDQIEVIINAN